MQHCLRTQTNGFVCLPVHLQHKHTHFKVTVRLCTVSSSPASSRQSHSIRHDSAMDGNHFLGKRPGLTFCRISGTFGTFAFACSQLPIEEETQSEALASTMPLKWQRELTRRCCAPLKVSPERFSFFFSCHFSHRHGQTHRCQFC